MLWGVLWEWLPMRPAFSFASSIQAKVPPSEPRERKLIGCFTGKQVLATMEKVNIKGMAHITGGGLLENVPRVLPENTVAELEKAAWPRFLLV